MAKCTICKQEIVLVPSAQERAAKCTARHSAKYYTSLFTEHSSCALVKREQETKELMQRINLARLQKSC